MNIQELINKLTEIKNRAGNLPVLGSSDEEQNSLGDIFDVQVGQITEIDNYNGKYKIGDYVVVLVPAI